jgi:DNA segregation ATPase FtsK/SpoIIIE-like protein
MTITTEQAKQAFELSAIGQSNQLTKDATGDYQSSSTQAAWEAWLGGVQWASNSNTVLDTNAVAGLARPGLQATEGGVMGSLLTGKHDPLYATAVQIVRSHNKASISLVQRHLRIGYNRAAYLIEAMEGTVVSHPRDGGIRDVLPAQGQSIDTKA